MIILQQSEATAARRRLPFYLLQDADGKTPVTGQTFSAAEIQVSKNGAAFANFGGSAAEIASGLYYYETTAGELDTVGFLIVRVNKGTARPFVIAAQVGLAAPGLLSAGGVTSVVDAVWDEATAGHVAGGSFGLAAIAANTRLPAALVSGRMDSSVGAMAADTITAAAIATDAVAEIQAGLATAAAVAAVQSDTDDIQTRLPAALVGGRMDASVGAMAASTITAAAIATDAIGSDELAASAITEIQAGLATAAAVAGIQSDTDDIQARLPAALVGGRMDSSVGVMVADTITAAAIATDAVAEIQAGLATAAAVAAVQSDTDDIQTRLPAALVGGRMDSDVGAMAANTITAAAIAIDAIGSDELAASAITEIQTGLATAAAVAAVQSSATALTAIASRIDGLVGDNNVVAALTKNANGDALTQRIRVYDTQANALADDGVGGLLETYNTVATYDGANSMDSFTITRVGS